MKNNEINGNYSRIEKSTIVKGDIVSEGDFRIEGLVNGSLNTSGKVVIGKTGSVEGVLSCKNADVEGKFKGTLTVSGTLSLRASALAKPPLLLILDCSTLSSHCSSKKVIDNVRDIVKGMRGYLPYVQGKYKLVIETTKKIEILTKQIVIQSKSLDEIERLASEKEKLMAAIPSIMPIKQSDLTRMASGFGYRTDPFNKSRKMHSGMDFTAPRNTPVYAASDGKIVRADSRSTGYGKHIRIDHGFGYVTLYAHLNKYNVKRGQNVKKGDVIGFVGSTGRSQAPHLHYEVQIDKKRVNPINFYLGNLTPDEFDELLRLANQENQSLD